MRVVVWNILHGGGCRAAAIARAIARRRADVAILTEFRATPPSCRLAHDLAAHGLAFQLTTAAADRPTRNAILLASRFPLSEVADGPGPGGERWLLAKVEAAVPLHVAGVHVPNRTTGRKPAFLGALLDFARAYRERPALLAGDLNSGRIGLDESVRCFDRVEDGFLQALEGAGWDDAVRMTYARRRVYTWRSPNGGNGFRLDHVFTTRALRARILGSRVAWLGRTSRLSDHAAVWMTLAE